MAVHLLSEKALRRAVLDRARALTGAPGDYDGLLDAVGDSSVVLLGEASSKPS